MKIGYGLVMCIMVACGTSIHSRRAPVEEFSDATCVSFEEVSDEHFKPASISLDTNYIRAELVNIFEFLNEVDYKQDIDFFSFRFEVDTTGHVVHIDDGLNKTEMRIANLLRQLGNWEPATDSTGKVRYSVYVITGWNESFATISIVGHDNHVFYRRTFQRPIKL
jgi:hypothetical protein